MTAMTIKNTIFPLRVSMKKKETWELIVDVENSDNQKKMVSVQISLPKEATFDQRTTTSRFEKRFDNFKPMGKETFKMPVFISTRYGNIGNFMGKVVVTEHFGDYAYNVKTFTKEIPFKIVP